MRTLIEDFITDYVKSYPALTGTVTSWLDPLVAYADPADPLFNELKTIISPSHLLPADLLPAARTVVAYFLPFEPPVPESNISGRLSSKTWATAYVETNTLIADLNRSLTTELAKHGYKAATLPATHDFDRVKLISTWSHRHVAYIAGLGKFGLNNMLITAKGCCGRIGTLVIDVPIAKTARPNREYCLYKLNGSCTACQDRCVNNALVNGVFDRQKCWAMCRENAAQFQHLGPASVCGKCLVGVPCSFTNPAAPAKS